MVTFQKIVDNLYGSKCITTMDTMEGYHQMKVKGPSVQYVIIITHQGLHQYLFLPSGTKHGWSYFKMFIDESLARQIREGWMIAYIDDILLYYKGSEEHAQNIAKVSAKLEKVNMTGSFSKFMVG